MLEYATITLEMYILILATLKKHLSFIPKVLKSKNKPFRKIIPILQTPTITLG